MSTPTAGSRQTDEGKVYTVTGGDWGDLFDAEGDPVEDQHLVVNLGPQHPSTHGVLRIVCDLDGETVQKARAVVGYLHTGIEKNVEYRTYTQATTFLTRADYLSPIFNEAGYCMAVEKLLNVEVPRRAQIIRVLTMEICRISSHWIWLATGGMELGSTTAATNGFRARNYCLDVLEAITGTRMNHAYIRPGGLAQDLPAGFDEVFEFWYEKMIDEIDGVDRLLRGQPIWINRLKGVGFINVAGCLQIGVTGPVLRAAGLPWDSRKTEPYLTYDEYDFDVPTHDAGDSWSRFVVRVAEMREALKICRQAYDQLKDEGPGPVMVEDRKIGWPAQLSIGADGMGNSLEHVRHIMGQSMESLIHHFKLVTEGFRVPAGQSYVTIEAPRGEFGVHVVSDGGTRPWRVHLREPSFINLQALPALSEGGLLADVIASVASLDPVMGGCDR
ncbi:NADH-quinone oxidoreductase subunit D [Blastococcus sp. Marseille-P5729]|uniref:NADH-quinone oxidoreductase subunit D n=1 Tax=Blastococcus sp. Marseille-P5729 TaxID=2086582 RepID=UPI000D10C6AA|nr:NADH-quinone oxidoreductase subunit D [Blastococcus sp. Marseille-P5729]